MKLYLTSRISHVNAQAEYDVKNKNFVVLKGSIVSKDIAKSATFRSTKSIEKWRAEYVNGNVVKKDIVFKSASTAANFVTGRSTNGLVVWKNDNNVKLKDLISTKVS